MKEYVWHTFPTTGYIECKLTEEDLQPVMEEINRIQSSFDTHTAFNFNLAGHLKHEYIIEDSFSHVEQLVKPLAIEHIRLFDDINNIVKSPDNLVLKSCWVNFQQKHEFNPIHRHSELISFVIWCKIPYTQQAENEFWKHIQDPRLAEKRLSGQFTFTYTDTIGGAKVMPVVCDKSTEYTLLVFPSSMHHSVNPFYTSDDYRITISGNIGIKNI
jgi:hypothetical protein